jgi:hypothetical protein
MASAASVKARDMARVGLLTICIETLLYGIYTALFFQSMYIMLKGIKGRSLSAKIFLSFTALMYIIATTHVSIGLRTLLVPDLSLEGTPEAEESWMATPRWEYTAYTVMNIVMLWLFDCLMIYRCYIIWAKNRCVIVAPIILFFATIAISLLAWWSTTVERSPFYILGKLAFPCTVLQNILTTSLISFRLVRQFRLSRAPGVQPSNSHLNLFDVVQILLESAALYTTLLLITIIFQLVESPSLWILIGMNTPSIGIVFTLISIRLHIVTTRAREHRTTLFTVSPWFNNTASSAVEGSQPVQTKHPLSTLASESLPRVTSVKSEPT